MPLAGLLRSAVFIREHEPSKHKPGGIYFAMLSLKLLDELELPPLTDRPIVCAIALPLGPVAIVLLLEVDDVVPLLLPHGHGHQHPGRVWHGDGLQPEETGNTWVIRSRMKQSK